MNENTRDVCLAVLACTVIIFALFFSTQCEQTRLEERSKVKQQFINKIGFDPEELELQND